MNTASRIRSNNKTECICRNCVNSGSARKRSVKRQTTRAIRRTAKFEINVEKE